MEANFTEHELDRLAEEFLASKLSLPRFTRSHGVPYMVLKKHLQAKRTTGFWNSHPSEERTLLVEELHRSQLSSEEFAAGKGIDPIDLARWIESDRKANMSKLPSEWWGLIEEFLAGECLTMAEFARSKELPPERFKYWLNKHDPERSWKKHGGNVKQGLVAEFSRGALSAPAFAKAKGLKEETFGSWLRKSDPERRISNRKPHLVRSRKEQTLLVEEFERSGTTVRKFAESQGIKPGTFGTWVTRERKRKL